MTILQCTSLSKHYGRGEELVKALEGVSLSLEQGSFTAITGPSGSGKSTLLHMLGGLDRPTEGSVQFRDKDLYRLRDDQLAILRRRQFGFVFQSYNLVRELTGMENILLPLMLDKRSPDEAYLNRLIDILGIGSRRNHLPSAMSGGHSSALPSPGLWPTSRKSSLPTSPRATWTARPGGWSWSCCGS